MHARQDQIAHAMALCGGTHRRGKSLHRFNVANTHTQNQRMSGTDRLFTVHKHYVIDVIIDKTYNALIL